MPIGVDIEDIKRFENKSQRFLDRVYTKTEQEYCLSKSIPAKHLAVRFCAKEATIKALTPLGVKISSLKDIEIYHENGEYPKIKLLNNIDRDLTFEVSLSHDRTKAIAFVTVATKQKML